MAVADVIKCNFVNEVYKYFKCVKYSITCCLDDTKWAYMNYKLSIFEGCDVPHEEQCRLSELDLTDYTMVCDLPTTNLDCSSQLSIALSKTTNTCNVTSVLSNPVDGSQFPRIYLQDDELYATAEIDLVTTAPTCGYSSTYRVVSGSYIDGATTYTNDDYNPHAKIEIQLDNVTSSPAGYIDTVYIFKTLAPGTIDPFAIEVDTNPTTSPYLSCAGCVTVSAGDLYFGNPNFTVALQNVLRNAALTLFGDDELGLFEVNNLGTTGYLISSRVKHNPTGLWIGLKTYNSRVLYTTNGVSFMLSDLGNTGVAVVSTPSIVDRVLTGLPCGSSTVRVQTINPTMQVVSGSTNFNKITLANDNSSTAATIASGGNFSCTNYTLSAVTIAGAPISTKVWRDPGSTIIGTGNSVTVTASGNYTFQVTLTNGCTDTETITV